MNKLPQTLLNYLNSEEGSIYKRVSEDKPYMPSRLGILEIEPSETFIEYFEVVDGVFTSESLHYEVLCFEDGGYNSVISQTQAVREHHSFPNKYVWFADAVELAGLVLDTETDYVYEIHFEGATDELLEGTLKPSWLSFKECISALYEYSVQSE